MNLIHLTLCCFSFLKIRRMYYAVAPISFHFAVDVDFIWSAVRRMILNNHFKFAISPLR